MRVTFVRTTSVINEPRVIKEAKVLKELGLDINIIFWDRIGIDKDVKSIDDIRTFPIFVGKAGYGKGIYNIKYRILLTLAILRKLKLLNPDIIHACDFDGLLPALIYKKINNNKVKIVYDIFDFIYTLNSPIPNILRNLIRKSEVYFLKFVDKIILPDENRLVFIPKEYHNRIYIVNNAPDVKSININEGNDKILRELNLSKNKLKLFYAGALSKDRGIMWLVEIAKKFPSKVEVIIAGEGILKEKIVEESKKLDNLKYLGKLKVEEIYLIYPVVDIVYVIYDPEFLNNQLSSPTKLFEALHFGKPVIIAKNTHWDKKVEDYDCGFVVDYSKESLIRLIGSLTKEKILHKARNTHNLYKIVSWENSKKNLISCYTDLMK